MKKLILMISLVGALASCSSNRAIYTWLISVEYTNGDKSTLICSSTANSVDNPKVFLGIRDGCSCVLMGMGNFSSPVVCGVRSFKILAKSVKPCK